MSNRTKAIGVNYLKANFPGSFFSILGKFALAMVIPTSSKSSHLLKKYDCWFSNRILGCIDFLVPFLMQSFFHINKEASNNVQFTKWAEWHFSRKTLHGVGASTDPFNLSTDPFNLSTGLANRRRPVLQMQVSIPQHAWIIQNSNENALLWL